MATRRDTVPSARAQSAESPPPPPADLAVCPLCRGEAWPDCELCEGAGVVPAPIAEWWLSDEP